MMKNSIIDIQHLPPKVRRALKPRELERHQPDRLLLGGSDSTPTSGLFVDVNQFLKGELLAARSRLGLDEDLVVIDFGPRSFDDFPLSEFLVDSFVFGLDIDSQAMEAAKQRLSGPEQARLVLLPIEASLIANEMIQGFRDSLEEYPTLNEALFWRFNEAWEKLSLTRMLPFADSSVDMAVSMGMMSSALAAAINAAVTGVFWDKYGDRASWAFMSEEISYRGRRLMRGKVLCDVTNSLYRRLVIRQLEELGRVVKPGGMVFVCDHAMRLHQDNFDGRFTFRRDELFPNDQYLLDIGVEAESDWLHFDIAKRAEGVRVVGADSMHTISRQVAGFESVDEFCFWDVNRLGHPYMAPAIYILNTAMLLQRAT